MSDRLRVPLIALCPEGIEIPGSIRDLPGFQEWSHSAAFPERGRIDWIAGRMEVDMSPEDLTTHGSPKSAIAGKLVSLIQEPELGLVFIDRARLSDSTAALSCEPDVIAIRRETLEAGGARLVPRAGKQDRFVEIEGAVDLVVECVSDSSVVKDRDRLRTAYFEAGVREYWLVDARGDEIDFQLLQRRDDDWALTAHDDEGFAQSAVLGRQVRLVRRRSAAALVFFRLEVR